MARTDHYIGLNKRGLGYTEGYKRALIGTFEGAFYNNFPLHAYLVTYEGTMKDFAPSGTVVYTEFVQASPWASGPHYFIALMTDAGSKVMNSLWTEKEIEGYL